MQPESFTCPRCGRTSYHPMDVANRYCGACHVFHPESPNRPESSVPISCAEWDCEGCGVHVVAVALRRPPEHMLCCQCAFLCEYVPDPAELVALHKYLNRDRTA
jgi:hypothetical protein